MITVVRSFVVAPPPRKVINYVQNFSRSQMWDAGTEYCQQIDEGPIAVGTQFDALWRFKGVAAQFIVTLEQVTDHSVVLVGRNGSATVTDTYTVSQAFGGGSEVTYRVEVSTAGLARLADPLIRLAFERVGSSTETNLIRALNAMRSELPKTW